MKMPCLFLMSFMNGFIQTSFLIIVVPSRNFLIISDGVSMNIFYQNFSKLLFLRIMDIHENITILIQMK